VGVAGKDHRVAVAVGDEHRELDLGLAGVVIRIVDPVLGRN